MDFLTLIRGVYSKHILMMAPSVCQRHEDGVKVVEEMNDEFEFFMLAIKPAESFLGDVLPGFFF